MPTVDVEEYRGLVRYWANIYKRFEWFRDIDLDDLEQEGFLGLLQAVGRFDFNRKSVFSTYASFWIRRNMLRMGSRHRKYRSALSSMAVSRRHTEGGNAQGLLNDILMTEANDATAHSIVCLDSRAREMIAARFGIGRCEESRKQIASRMGMSVEGVRQIEKRSLKRLRRSAGIIAEMIP